jgi:hypothetical protein
MSDPGIAEDAGRIQPGNFKSLFNLSLVAPSLVLIGGVYLYTVASGRHPHSPILVVFGSIWCAGGGLLLAMFTVRNLFPQELYGARKVLLDWLLLPRTRRYLAQVDMGDPAVLFSRSAVRKLRTLNRVAMVLITLVLASSTYSLVVTSSIPALEAGSTGSMLSALALIGVVLVAFVMSRIIRLLVRRDATRRVQRETKGG